MSSAAVEVLRVHIIPESSGGFCGQVNPVSPKSCEVQDAFDLDVSFSSRGGMNASLGVTCLLNDLVACPRSSRAASTKRGGSLGSGGRLAGSDLAATPGATGSSLSPDSNSPSSSKSSSSCLTGGGGGGGSSRLGATGRSAF